ncbi:MAG: glucans biosynthesis glucosyltransferase MdoH [Loktanella sp.]|nr:glucans biosynthesis glucosyltransferase MdoH [Loktanella sp.]
MSVLLWLGLDTDATAPALASVLLVLFSVSTYTLISAAGIAVIGAMTEPAQDYDAVQATDRCAVLWLVCGEPPEVLARRIGQFLNDQQALDPALPATVFVLSDTQGTQELHREAAALASLDGRITYRNRSNPTGRKGGNLGDWLNAHGADFDTMLVLDADSGFSPQRLASMRARMMADDTLGLIQSAIRLRPAQTRFGQMQRLSARISGPVFERGMAALTGDSGNYWGHNALIRVAAFQQVTPLPVLSGRPPFGGPVLSHDFVEAAFLRRAGWKVVIDPSGKGSFEDAPETISAHLRRDRRWAQGNLQHLRLVGARGLHAVSRMHLIAGIQSYMSAPIWLTLVVLTGSGAVHATAAVLIPLSGVLLALLVPKLAGQRARRVRYRSARQKRILRRAFLAELGMTTLFAPIGMVRRTGFILSVLMGRTSGWIPSGQQGSGLGPNGLVESSVGAFILLAVTLPQALIGTSANALLSGLLVMPIVLPLLFAPFLYRWFDRPRETNAVADYYNASTRRFLATGGSGAALAIHRPLWAEGVTTPEQAAGHVNTLIAKAAEQALGHPPSRVHDLGCGVGGTVFQLAARWPETTFCGVTISAEQVALARQFATASGLETRCQFQRSDFTRPMAMPDADLVIAVESHVHAPDAATFLHAARRHLRPGGVLIVVDDMLTCPDTTLSPAQAHLVVAFRRGWRLGHVPTQDGLVTQAQSLGYAHLGTSDLTPLLRLNRWRDLALRVVGPLADRVGLAGKPLFDNMIGGNALTESYRAGIMRYTLLTLRRDAIDSTFPAPCDKGLIRSPDHAG